RADHGEAHDDLSFRLSNLGDFEGALRETKRAVELDPYYVAQKFELAIDLEYEDPDLSIQPDLGAVQRTEENVEDFAFDPGVLDSLFTTLAPVASAAENGVASGVGDRDAYAMATDYLAMGLYERAAAEVSRALLRGASLGDFDGAIAAYRHALELDQDFAVVRYNLARLLRAKGHLREAEQELEGALDAVPTYAEATLELSSLRRSSGRTDEALDLL